MTARRPTTTNGSSSRTSCWVTSRWRWPRCASWPTATAGDATELRYLRADILYFKLQKLDDAGREYLAVGKSQPVGKYHKDALLQAMTAFEKLRKPAPGAGGASGAGKREITDSDRQFAEA